MQESPAILSPDDPTDLRNGTLEHMRSYSLLVSRNEHT